MTCQPFVVGIRDWQAFSGVCKIGCKRCAWKAYRSARSIDVVVRFFVGIPTFDAKAPGEIGWLSIGVLMARARRRCPASLICPRQPMLFSWPLEDASWSAAVMLSSSLLHSSSSRKALLVDWSCFGLYAMTDSAMCATASFVPFSFPTCQ